jgi:multimeric flavodoxin WrbA
LKEVIEGGCEMKILAITGNPRKSGALAALTEETVKGSAKAGANVQIIRLAEGNIGCCRFCLQCYKDFDARIGKCAQEDDMDGILKQIDEADGFILSCPMSSGHENAIMKVFEERCTYTLGRPARRILWVKGIPESRIKDKKRYAVVITTAGSVPTWSRVLCNGSTREMSALARDIFNAEVVGKLYAGGLRFRELMENEKEKAVDLGRVLTERIKAGR